jgi:chemotaxis methyl-accepting protein methylase
MRNIGRAGDSVWRRLPPPMRDGLPGRAVGICIHALSRKFSNRRQTESTWFLRNEPLLSTVLEIINGLSKPGAEARICSMGCSSGAEIYSILWTVRRARPDLDVIPLAVDISAAAIEKGRAGYFLLQDKEFRGAASQDAGSDLFEMDGKYVRIKNWIGQGIQWSQADASDPGITAQFGAQDVVLANNFLIHMEPRKASATLANVSRMVKPWGFLICRGVDLDIRQQVTAKLGLKPISNRIEQIHDAELDLDARRHWPWKYYGLEPLNKNRRDWLRRYSAVFQVPVRG